MVTDVILFPFAVALESFGGVKKVVLGGISVLGKKKEKQKEKFKRKNNRNCYGTIKFLSSDNGTAHA